MSLKKLALTCTATILLALAAASADTIDFTCALGKTEQCTGTVMLSGSKYTMSGTHLFNDQGPYGIAVPFLLSLETGGAIGIKGTGVQLGQNLEGHLTGFSVLNTPSSTDLTFDAELTALPLLAQEFLGTKTGDLIGSVLTSGKVTPISPGKVESVDLLITATPEPISILLFGSGLLAIGVVLHRKLRRQ
jgi:hypothetical protein